MRVICGIIVATIGGAVAASFGGPVGSAFASTSLLVSRLGRVGTLEPITTSGTVPVYIDEFAPNGTLVQSLLVPGMTQYTGNPMVRVNHCVVEVF